MCQLACRAPGCQDELAMTIREDTLQILKAVHRRGSHGAQSHASNIWRQMQALQAMCFITGPESLQPGDAQVCMHYA